MKRNNSAKQIALGGIMASLAVVIMCFGGMMPGLTYVTAILCALILKIVYSFCGKRIAWAWYGAVSILSLLMGPNKEAACMFVFLGNYPIFKPVLDKTKPHWLWKSLYFNGSFVVMYALLTYVFGLAQISLEFKEMALGLMIFTIVLGNCIFWTVDFLLSDKVRRMLRRRG